MSVFEIAKRRREQSNVQEEAEKKEKNSSVFSRALEENPERTPRKEKPADKTIPEYALGAAKQALKEGVVGATGAYGGVLDFLGSLGKFGGLGGSIAGAQTKSDFPSDEARYAQESEILQAMQQPGYEPSFYDFEALSSDDIGQNYPYLPTPQQVRSSIEDLGGPGKPENPFEDFAGRTANFLGTGAAFGQTGAIPAIFAGAAGAGSAFLGAPEWLQSVLELVATTKGGGPKQGLVGGSAIEEAEIQHLRNLGYNDNEITLALRGAERFGPNAPRRPAPKATKGAQTEGTFQSVRDTSENLVRDIIRDEFPGIGLGTDHLHQVASNLYGQVAQAGRNIVVTNSQPFVQRANNVIRQLENTLGTNPEVQPFIQRLREAAADITQAPTADRVVNFYKELNAAGKWVGRDQRDRLLREIKTGVIESLEGSSSHGRQFARQFEFANRGVQRAYEAEELMTLINKSETANGLDFNKFRKTFDNQENRALMERILGQRQTENLFRIARVGKEVGDFDKAWKAVQKGGVTDTLISGGIIYNILNGSWAKAIGLSATAAARDGVYRMRELFLTDPRYQNIHIRFLNALRNRSPRAFATVNEDFRKLLDEEGINEDDLN